MVDDAHSISRKQLSIRWSEVSSKSSFFRSTSIRKNRRINMQHSKILVHSLLFCIIIFHQVPTRIISSRCQNQFLFSLNTVSVWGIFCWIIHIYTLIFFFYTPAAGYILFSYDTFTLFVPYYVLYLVYVSRYLSGKWKIRYLEKLLVSRFRFFFFNFPFWLRH